MRYRNSLSVIGLIFAGLAGCGDVSEITAEDEARIPDHSLATGGSAPAEETGLVMARTVSPGLSQQGIIDGCTPGRLCSQPRTRQVASTGPDASAYFETGRAQAANAQAQGRIADQRILLNNGRPETVPGQRAGLSNSRSSLQQQELRLQRDRLRTAPYGQTVGSIYAQ